MTNETTALVCGLPTAVVESMAAPKLLLVTEAERDRMMRGFRERGAADA